MRKSGCGRDVYWHSPSRSISRGVTLTHVNVKVHTFHCNIWGANRIMTVLNRLKTYGVFQFSGMSEDKVLDSLEEGLCILGRFFEFLGVHVRNMLLECLNT